MPHRRTQRRRWAGRRGVAALAAVCLVVSLAQWTDGPATGDTTPGSIPSVTLANSVTGGGPQPNRTAAAPTTATSVSGAAAGNKAGATAWTATPLSPASAWSAGSQGGSFTYSVPMAAPPAAGPTPSVGLAYDSGSVDGETGATNNQPSPVGEGWTLAAGGYIDRSYLPCAQDGTQAGDLCWQSDNGTASFAGHSGQLVRDGAGNTWRFQSDDGTIVTYVDPTNGGTRAGDYWKVVTPDGTQYFFGRGAGPNGDIATNSRWTVPVAGNNANEPCYHKDSPDFAGSFCPQAWRWNLDYVVDPHGNAEALYYQAEANHYAQGDPATDAAYTRGGELTEIDYAMRAGDEAAGGGARVLFTYGGRCVATACPTLGQAGFDAAKWPDVPWEDYCAAGCTSRQGSPTFFSTQELASVHTEYGPTASPTTVNRWDLQHSFPDPHDGQDAALWLEQVAHTGQGDGPAGAVTDPPTVFDGGQALPNRIYGPDGPGGADGLPLFFKYRIQSVLTSAGARISPEYGTGAGTALSCGTEAAPQTPTTHPADNRQLCFPSTWWDIENGEQYPTKPDQEWFYKYVVTSVTTDVWGGDHTVAGQSVVTQYTYGTPAWRQEKSPLVATAARTYSVWAGFDQVQAITGDTNDPTRVPQQSSTTKYFQGLNGDVGKSPTSKPLPQGAVADDLWLAGRAWEQQTTLGVGGAALSTVYTAPYASAATATDGALQARFVADGDVQTVTGLFTAAGTQSGSRTTETHTTYDSYRPTEVSDLGDVSTSADDRCQRTTYAANAAANMLTYPSEVDQYSATCSPTLTVGVPSQVLAISRYGYDGQAPGAATPTVSAGDVTETDTLKGYSGTTPQFLVDTSAYDALGRPTTSTQVRDGTSRSTTTAYTPSGAGLTTQTTATAHNAVTDPGGWTTTTALDPAWGAPVSITDQNGKLTTARYDGDGRLTAVWQPGNPQAGNNPPSTEYTYQLSQTAVDYVGTRSLGPSGTALPWSYTIYDGVLRPRQTQAPAEGGGRTVTDTLYGSTGQVIEQTGAYYTDDLAEGALFQPQNRQQIPSTTQYTLDGAGRVTDAELVVHPDVPGPPLTAWDTITSYRGDRVTVNPNYDSAHPAVNGGTPTTTVYDARGQVSALTQYLGNNLDTAGTQTTTYGYDRWGNQSAMTDPAGNAWSWTYGFGGRLLSATDPDTGTTTYNAYTDDGQPTSVTDAATKTLAYSYDALGRKTAEYATSTAGTQLAGWTYDSIAGAKGYPVASTRYVAGQPYTTSVLGYDSQYRPTSSKVSLPATAPAGLASTSYTTSVGYNADGSVANVSEPAVGGLAAETLSYRYTALGSLLAENSGALSVVARAQYTRIGQLAQYSQGYGAVIARNYLYDEGTGRLDSDMAFVGRAGATVATDAYAVVDNTAYSYDNAGNPVQLADTAPAAPSPSAMSGSDVQCFSYDGLQRLTQAWTTASACSGTGPASSAAVVGASPYWQSYAYDAVGDRTSMVNHATSVAGSATTTDTYSVGAAGGVAGPHALGTVTHSSGAAAESYGYTPAGGLSSVARPAGTPVLTLGYDAEERLSTMAAGAATQSRTYDADGHLLLQATGATSTLYLGDTELTVTAAGSQAVRTYTAFGQPQAQRVATTTGGATTRSMSFLITNGQGSATSSIDATTGAVTNRYFLPFGGTRTTPAQATTWPAVPHGFLNSPLDAFSGLTHLGARDYNTTLGQFTTPDPVLDPSDPQQTNPYAYAGGNPVATADPSGLCPKDKCGAESPSGGSNLAADFPSSSGNGASSSPANPARGNEVDGSKVIVPSINNPQALENMWLLAAGNPKQSYWDPGEAGNGMLCFGAAACEHAYYSLVSGSSVEDAKDVAANFCLQHVSKCAFDAQFAAAVNSDLTSLQMLFALVATEGLAGSTTGAGAAADDGLAAALQKVKPAAEPAPVAVNGETAATAYGKAMHASYDYGPGFEREVTLPSGRRVDALNMNTREVRELKPNNPRKIREGTKQLDGYIAELNETYPGTPWTGKVVTYDRP